MPAASSSVMNMSETVDGDRDEERVERGLRPADVGLLDLDRRVDRGEDGPRDVQVVGGQARETRDLPEGDPLGRVVGQARDGGLDDRLRAAQPEDVDRADERQGDLAAGDDHVDVARRLGEHGVRERVVGLSQPRLDRGLHELALERVGRVVVDLDRRRLPARERERAPQPVRGVLGDDDRAERLARAHPLDRLLARLHPDRVDRLEQARRVVGDVELPAPDRELALAGRDEVGEGDLRLVRRPVERKAHEQRDDDRVDDQQHHQQRRAAQDLQVLEQQPAHLGG
jgi:hypothetical protein